MRAVFDRRLRAPQGGFAVLIVVLGLAGCNKADEPANNSIRVAHAVLVEPAGLALMAGDRRQLAAEVNDDAGRSMGGVEIVYRSGAEAIAEVSPSGLVSAVGPTGTTYVEVASGGLSVRVPVTITAGAAAALEVLDAPPATVVAGEAAGQIKVRARDRFGNGVGEHPLSWQVLAGGGSVESAAAATGVDGLASATWVAGVNAGQQILEVRAGELPPVLVQSTAIAGPPAKMTLEAEPPVSDTAFPLGTVLNVKALLSDRHGNPVTGTSVVFEASGGCPLEPTSRTDESAGAHSVDWPLSSVGSCELRARAAGSDLEVRLAARIVRPRN